MDIGAYISEKASARGMRSIAYEPESNFDGRAFIIAKGLTGRFLAVSGLELLQNNKDQMMQDLIDSRFEDAVRAMGE